jgi:uncharacterized coiled-coil DUF342 family protein
MADDAILAAINEMRGEMSELRSDMSELRSDMTELRGNMSELRTNVRGEITELRVAVMGRFDRMEERFSQMADDVVVGMGRADRAHKAADNTRDELRALSTEVATLTRKQLRLEAQFHEFTRPA